jgi:hypothetical protein
MTPKELVRRRKRTLRAWLVRRRFRHWSRPKSMAGAKADWGVGYLTRKLGPRHPYTLEARARLAVWLSEEDDNAGALRLTEAEVADRAAEFGADHSDTLSARMVLVSRRHAVGDLPGAMTDLRALVQDTSRTLGPEHTETHRQRRRLAELIGEGGEKTEAVRLLTGLLAEVEGFGPKRYDDMRLTRRALARALERNGDIQKALGLVEKEIDAQENIIYGVDEYPSEYDRRFLRDWCDRLALRATRTDPAP